ncbi:hypothetical protein BS78_03G229700 [Paspalum vaginatum]|nr:hypothetical protein BS78_03G229700 [Paspalum vaginatum]
MSPAGQRQRQSIGIRGGRSTGRLRQKKKKKEGHHRPRLWRPLNHHASCTRYGRTSEASAGLAGGIAAGSPGRSPLRCAYRSRSRSGLRRFLYPRRGRLMGHRAPWPALPAFFICPPPPCRATTPAGRVGASTHVAPRLGAAPRELVVAETTAEQATSELPQSSTPAAAGRWNCKARAATIMAARPSRSVRLRRRLRRSTSSNPAICKQGMEDGAHRITIGQQGRAEDICIC